jgi:cytochrome d ubiquinol oxidase subunit I
MLRTGIALAALLAPVQIWVGDAHGLNTLEHQPAKIAAIEAIWHGGRGVPLLLFAIPNPAERRNDFEIAIPDGASLILRHDPQGELQGLDAFEGRHPPVAPVFFAFRVMVGMGVLMLALAWWGAWRLWRGGAPTRWMLRAFAAATFSGWIAVLAGWIVTEVGRQPYLVYGVLRVAETASSVSAGSIALSLAGYLLVYTVLLLAFMLVLTQMALDDARGAGAAPQGPGPGGLRARSA